MKYFVLIAISGILLFSCTEEKRGLNIGINSNEIWDTIYISELGTEKEISKIYDTEEVKTIQLTRPTVVSLHSGDYEIQYLSILTPKKNLNITVNPDSTLTTKSKSDSLLNYLWKSNLDFINKNSSFIFQTDNIDSIPILLDDFRKIREKAIDKYKNQFGNEVADILYFQNNARIYLFQFWLGRVDKELDPHRGYFDFIKMIPGPSETLKSLPNIYLNKYEIEYLRIHQSIEDIPSFLSFIETKTKNKDLADLLKAVYIKSLIEIPFYWQKHERLFNSEVLENVLTREKNNKYSDLIEKASKSFYASQNGKNAYMFEAEDNHGKSFNLKELEGKVIFIDTWATWCGPCIEHRPKVLELAKKYKDEDDVVILMVSADSSKDKWLAFLQKENEEAGVNLFIKNGMRTDFGRNYNIKSIPKYILIGKNGKIINSNLIEPSIEVEGAIEKEIGL